MKIKTVRLDDFSRSLLLRSKIDGNNLTLPEQLAPDDYRRIAKVIEAAGGKWNRKSKCHVFSYAVSKTMDITEESISITNVQQTFQNFYTPIALARRMCNLADLHSNQALLEPSAGEGVLITAAREICSEYKFVTSVEINPACKSHLDSISDCVFIGDFLNFSSPDKKPELFDRILMNPPFARNQDILHILHARKFLAKKGRLVAIFAAGVEREKELRPFSDDWIPLPPGTFAAVGTNVNTILISINNL